MLMLDDFMCSCYYCVCTWIYCFFFFFSSRRRHTRFDCDWSSDVCSSDLDMEVVAVNDLFDNAHLAYLLKYDTVMRVFDRQVSADADAMFVDGRKVVMKIGRASCRERV